MPQYDYDSMREKLFTDKGQRLLLAVRDIVHKLLPQTGAVRVDVIERAVRSSFDGTVDLDEVLACLDRLVELRELRLAHEAIADKYRIYIDQFDDTRP